MAALLQTHAPLLQQRNKWLSSLELISEYCWTDFEKVLPDILSNFTHFYTSSDRPWLTTIFMIMCSSDYFDENSHNLLSSVRKDVSFVFYRISCVIDSENSNQFNSFTTILKSKLLVTQIQRLANIARITFSRVFKVSLFITSSQYVKLKRSNNSKDSEPFQLPHTIYCHYAEILTSHTPWLRLWVARLH